MSSDHPHGPPLPLLHPTHLLEVQHVAHRLNVGPEFVRRLIRSGDLPHIRVGKRYRVDARDLEVWIATHRRIAAGERVIDQGLAKATTHLQVVRAATETST
jgi:excisionase family DNA binding protein